LYQKLHCTGYARVNKTTKLVSLKSEHVNHVSSPHLMRKKMVLSDIRVNANTAAPRSVVTSALADLDDVVKSNLPKMRNLQKNASRFRKGSGKAVPESLDEVFLI
jgi:hypothetical protein